MAVDRNYILNKMKGKIMTPQEFNFDALQGPPLYSLLTPTDVGDLNKLATSIRYSGNPMLRLDRIDQILRNRGFRKFTGGTNRVIYKFLEDDSFLIKVASDAVGIGDSPREWINQHHYKPFVPKVFEVSPCGTVGLSERVIPITSREEFLTIASDVYDVIRNWFTGEYVMDDIGSKYFMNWGIRKGFGPVLLDFPYSYKLDGNKLYCNIPNSNNPSIKCGGVIDYDDGFNHLRCTKCGAIYRAKELMKAVDNNTVIIKGGKCKMKVSFGYGDDVRVVNNTAGLDSSPKFVTKQKAKSVVGTLKVVTTGGTPLHKEEEPVSEPEIDTSSDEIDGFYAFNGEITNTRDIDEESEVSAKCISLIDENGDMLVKDNKYVVITHLGWNPITNYAILTKEAYNCLLEKCKEVDELRDEVTTLKEENNKLDAQVFNNNGTIRALNDKIAELEEKNNGYEVKEQIEESMNSDYKEVIDSLTESNKKLEEENKNLKDSLDNHLKALKELEIKSANLESQLKKEPWYINSSGNKIDRKTGKRWKETDNEAITFDVSSPLIPESNEDIKKDIKDQDLVRRIDKILPDDKMPEYVEENSDEEDAVEEPPVGSVPPNNKSQVNSNQHQNRGYKGNFINKKNKKGKNKDKKVIDNE